jgi:hypothetical protein
VPFQVKEMEVFCKVRQGKWLCRSRQSKATFSKEFEGMEVPLQGKASSFAT